MRSLKQGLGRQPDKFTDETADAYWEAVDDLFATEPTTLAGGLAMLRFADQLIADGDQDLVSENVESLVGSLTAAMSASV
jgi:hypothetical protein